MTSKLRLIGFSIFFLNVEKVRYDGDGMVEGAWTTTALSATSSLENTRDKGKIELYTCTCQPVVSEPGERGRKYNFKALKVEGDCVIDFCLERDSYDSGYC